jgi:O-acetylhomoserine (thiol)-lyase
MKPETIALHAGYAGDPATNAATTPIYQTTSFTFNDSQHGADLFNLAVPGNIYSRIMNPTNAVLEQRLAELEGGVGALAVASGMAAIRYSIEAIAEVGCNIVSTSQLYGGTYNLFAHTFPRQGLEVRFAVADDLERVKSLIDGNTRALFCESIGNPAGNVVDIEAWAEIAHAAGVPLIVDNTVATPFTH